MLPWMNICKSRVEMSALLVFNTAPGGRQNTLFSYLHCPADVAWQYAFQKTIS